KRTSRFMKHWTYPLIFAKLSSLCEESGVQISYINSTYTSQRCSQCGWVRKTNRKESQFKCTLCGFASDADLNASKNISLNLPAINKEKRLSKSNRTGFYWNEIDKKCIVPYSQKLISYFYI
ncbi:MAG TPA: zinc ribbon domain-containing protein, partial [Candidatus Paceibacterota bacterium]|nr:zinc ribbon domain-containing protein [Candidatus Paceibacterota bacterium]